MNKEKLIDLVAELLFSRDWLIQTSEDNHREEEVKVNLAFFWRVRKEPETVDSLYNSDSIKEEYKEYIEKSKELLKEKGELCF